MKKESLSLAMSKLILVVSFIVGIGAVLGAAGYVLTKQKRIISPTPKTISAIEVSANQKSILNAETKKVIFTIEEADKYLKDSGYAYNPDTFQDTNAKYAGDCFLSANLSNNEDRIVFSSGCLPGDLPQAWVGVYRIRALLGSAKCAVNVACNIPNATKIRFLIGGSGRNFVWSDGDKTITYEADLGLSGLTETRTIDALTGEVLEKIISQNKSVGQQIYKNSKYGFEITFPDKDWYLPSEDDEDPHFYASEACANSERSNCFALEIQNHDNDSEYSGGWQAMFDTLRANNQNPTKLTSLIPDATVIKSEAPGPAEGWSYEYNVYFEKSKRIFLIFTNTETLERDIIPTFKLVDWETYTNEKFGYTLMYPGNWYFYGINTSDVFIQPEEELPDSIPGPHADAFEITTESIDTGSNLLELIRSRYEQAGINSTMDSIIIGGQKGSKVISICDGVGCGAPEWFVVKGDHLYNFKSNLGYNENFDQILSTFKFTGEGEKARYELEVFGNYSESNLDQKLVKIEDDGKKEVLVPSVKEALPELKDRFNLLLSEFSFPQDSTLIFFKSVLIDTDNPGGIVYSYDLITKEFKKLKINEIYDGFFGGFAMSPDQTRFIWIPQPTDDGDDKKMYLVNLLKDDHNILVELKNSETFNGGRGAMLSEQFVEWIDKSKIKFAVYDQSKKSSKEYKLESNFQEAINRILIEYREVAIE